MFTTQIATPNMENELKFVLKKSFESEPDNIIEAFFKKRVVYNNCLITSNDSKIIAALYFFDSHIIVENQKISAYYLYCIGTLPLYRGKGIMTSLLTHTKSLAKQRGISYLFLLPQTKKLYDFYQKRGFKKFFKKRDCLILKNEMEKHSHGLKPNLSTQLTLHEIYNIRKKFFSLDGNIVWDIDHLNYALKLNELEGGCVVCSKHGYAICTKPQSSRICIRDFAVENLDDFPQLISNIKAKANCQMYLFRTLPSGPLFQNIGIISDHGMIYAVNNTSPLPNVKNPYIGLTME